MTTLEESWEYQEKGAAADNEDALCLMDLRRRVEALEQRATPAPAADRPLWRVMHKAWNATGVSASDATGYAAEIDAVADWLAALGWAGCADTLRAEARRAREGA